MQRIKKMTNIIIFLKEKKRQEQNIPKLTCKQQTHFELLLSLDNQLEGLEDQELTIEAQDHSGSQIHDNDHLLSCCSGWHQQTSSEMKKTKNIMSRRQETLQNH